MATDITVHRYSISFGTDGACMWTPTATAITVVQPYQEEYDIIVAFRTAYAKADFVERLILVEDLFVFLLRRPAFLQVHPVFTVSVYKLSREILLIREALAIHSVCRMMRALCRYYLPR